MSTSAQQLGMSDRNGAMVRAGDSIRIVDEQDGKRLNGDWHGQVGVILAVEEKSPGQFRAKCAADETDDAEWLARLQSHEFELVNPRGTA